VEVHTPLFENGRIDSLAILHLIGAIEDHTGQPVPDHLVSMKYFHSIETIVTTFGTPTS
jgi:acyl carrier protein